jgi:hypothetical protein
MPRLNVLERASGLYCSENASAAPSANLVLCQELTVVLHNRIAYQSVVTQPVAAPWGKTSLQQPGPVLSRGLHCVPAP